MNLLFIVADQWRGDTLGALGTPGVSTPHLDALAGNGTTFTRHFSQASPCGPSRASMLTGLYMMNHRQVGNWTPMSPGLTNIAELLHDAGYDCGLIGYTDTPVANDGAHAKPEDAPERWICPGFRVVEPFLFSQGFANWRAHLTARGYDVPAGNTRIFLASPDTGREGGRNFPASYYAAQDSDTAFLTDAAVRFIAEAGARPWFLHFNCLRPHPPIVAPSPYHDLIDPDDVQMPRRPAPIETIADSHPLHDAYLQTQRLKEYFGEEIASRAVSETLERRMRATYYGNCAEVDANIGRLVNALKEAGVYEDTLIVFTSDHGDQLGDNWIYGRRAVFDGHFHVPLVFHNPRRIPANATRRAFTEHVDLAPTFLELLGLDVDQHFDGVSLLPLIHDQTASLRDAAHFELDFRDYPGREMPRILGLEDHRCNASVLRTDEFKYVHCAGLAPMLFDYRDDPGETRNVASDPRYAGVVAEYAQRMLDWRLSHQREGFTFHHQVYGERLIDSRQKNDPGR